MSWRGFGGGWGSNGRIWWFALVYLRDAWVDTKLCLVLQEVSKTCICGASATIIDGAYRGGESHDQPEVHSGETDFELELNGNELDNYRNEGVWDHIIA